MAPGEMLNKLKKLFANAGDLPSANEQLAKDLREILKQSQLIVSEKQDEVRVLETLLHCLDTEAPAGELKAVPKEQRGQAVLKVAEEIIRQGQTVVTPPEVLITLKTQDIDLGVAQPLTVIGNVLARSPKFRRLARNQFEWIGEK